MFTLGGSLFCFRWIQYRMLADVLQPPLPRRYPFSQVLNVCNSLKRLNLCRPKCRGARFIICVKYDEKYEDLWTFLSGNGAIGYDCGLYKNDDRLKAGLHWLVWLYCHKCGERSSENLVWVFRRPLFCRAWMVSFDFFMWRIKTWRNSPPKKWKNLMKKSESLRNKARVF